MLLLLVLLERKTKCHKYANNQNLYRTICLLCTYGKCVAIWCSDTMRPFFKQNALSLALLHFISLFFVW